MRIVELASGVISVVLLVAYGCSGNHDRLKKQDAQGGMGGLGGEGGDDPTTSGAGGDGGTGGISEPPGDPQLTIVNGTVDEDAIRFCFVPYPAGATSETPWPASERLTFAHGEVVSIGDVIPPATDVEVIVLSGPLSATDGRDCAELLSTPPTGVLTTSIGILGEGVFTTEKNILLTTSGCIGGRDHSHENEEQICGEGYTVDLPTATMVAGFTSRLAEPNKVPLQFVQASRAVGNIQLRVRPATGATAQQAVNEWTFGSIAPYPPYMTIGEDQLDNISQASVELYLVASTSPLDSTAWSDAFANSNLTQQDVQNGTGLAFVGVGAAPTIGPGPWWNAYSYTVIRADPGAE